MCDALRIGLSTNYGKWPSSPMVTGFLSIISGGRLVLGVLFPVKWICLMTRCCAGRAER